MGKLKHLAIALGIALLAIWLANNVAFIGGLVAPRTTK